MSDKPDSAVLPSGATVVKRDEVPPQLIAWLDDLNSKPPWVAVTGYILGRAKVIALQLSSMYERIRDGRGKYARLPEPKDQESAALVDRCLRLLALSISAQKEKSGARISNDKESFLALWIDYQAHYHLYMKMIELRPADAAAAPTPQKADDSAAAAVDEEDDECSSVAPDAVAERAPADERGHTSETTEGRTESNSETQQCPSTALALRPSDTATTASTEQLSQATEQSEPLEEPSLPPASDDRRRSKRLSSKQRRAKN